MEDNFEEMNKAVEADEGRKPGLSFDVLTLFPEMFAPLQTSMLGRAQARGLLSLRLVNIRDFAVRKSGSVDDKPVGGGAGRLMEPAPLFGALRSVGADKKKVIYMSPRGKKLSQAKLEELSKEEEIVILCGHYEGVDQRVLDYWNAEEISIGDYVLTGGELPAMVLIDAVTRLIPGVLRSVDAALEESIYSGLLEYPQYVRPVEYEGMNVPEVLLSGDHGKVALWQFEKSLEITAKNRPDLFRNSLRITGNSQRQSEK